MSLLPDLQAWLDEAAARHGDVAGAAIAVGRGGELAEAATGVVNRNTGLEATPDSVFQIGSVTKVWTACLVLQLVDEGLVKLDEPVRAYLPEFAVSDPEVTDTVTVRELLSHIGGFDGDLFEDTGRGDDALDKFLTYLHGAAQVQPRGTLFSYCNSGFCVLGALVAKLRGGTWEEAMRTHLIAPLGATHMALLAEEAILFRAAAGHVKMPGQHRAVTLPMWQTPRSNGPAGSTACAAPRELVRFGRMLLAGGVADDGTRLLSEESVAAMRTPQVDVPGLGGLLADRWGLGMELFEWDGTAVFGHDGGTPGQSTVWRVIPDRDVVIAMNVNGPGVIELLEQVFAPALAEAAGVRMPALPRPPADPVPRGDISPYLGRYAGPMLAYEVAPADDGLDVTLIPGEFAMSFGAERSTDRYVRVAGGTFVSAEPDNGMHSSITFVDNGRYLHNGRALPRVDS